MSLALNNFLYVLFPLLVQIAVSYIATKFTPAHSFVGYITSLSLINVPISIAGMGYHLLGDAETSLFIDMWLNCSLILQSAFYFVFENGTPLVPAQWIGLLIVFMNEFTFYGGNWFGHQVITLTAMFFIIKVFVSVASKQFAEYEQKIWSGLIITEYVSMIAITLGAMFLGPTPVVWFVPGFLLAIPYAYPTENVLIPPSVQQKGLLSIAPAMRPIMIKNEEGPKEE